VGGDQLGQMAEDKSWFVLDLIPGEFLPEADSMALQTMSPTGRKRRLSLKEAIGIEELKSFRGASTRKIVPAAK